MRKSAAGIITALAAVIALASACAPSGGVGPTGPGDVPGVRIFYPQATFQARTIRDWKSLGDAIVIADITASRVENTGAGDPNLNGGFTGRTVTVLVDTMLWERDAAHAPPGTFDMNAWGTVLRGSYQQPIVAAGEPRLEPNHTYLLVLAKFPTGWAPLGDGSEAPFDNGVLGYGEWSGKVPDDSQPALMQLNGENAAQVQAAIDATPADPRSAQYGDLDPLARAQKLGKASK